MAVKKVAAKKTAAKPRRPPQEAARATKKKRPTSAEAGTLPEADPRFVPVAKALGRMPGFSLMESKSGALRGMMLHGKSFGMSSHGRFILKLGEEKTAELIADGSGKPFSMSAGRVMKGWLEVTKPDADWVALAKLAYRLASDQGARTRTKKTKG